MLLSFIEQITNWNNQILLIPTITKMASYALQQLAFLLPLCTFLGNWKKTMKRSAFLS